MNDWIPSKMKLTKISVMKCFNKKLKFDSTNSAEIILFHLIALVMI